MKEKCRKIWGRHKKGWSSSFQGKILQDAKEIFPNLKGKTLLIAIWNRAFWSENENQN